RAALFAADFPERIARVNGFDDFLFGNELGRGPVVRVADVHVFDEAHGEVVLAGKFDERNDITVVDTAFDDGIQLDGRKTGALGDKIPSRTLLRSPRFVMRLKRSGSKL